MFGVKDPTVWSKIEQLEVDQPSPRKVTDGRNVYRSYRTPHTLWSGLPIITDFGAARFGDPGEMHAGDVMPDIYRAPEIILGMEFDTKIDMWSIGLMVSSSPISGQSPSKTLMPLDMGPVRGHQPLPNQKKWLHERRAASC
jgi:serine/threonine protein kinase